MMVDIGNMRVMEILADTNQYHRRGRGPQLLNCHDPTPAKNVIWR